MSLQTILEDMPRLLAINYNSNLIRYVLGTAERGGSLRVEEAGERTQSPETQGDTKGKPLSPGAAEVKPMKILAQPK